MQFRFDHDTTREKARAKIESLLKDVQSRYGSYVSDVEQSWSGDILDFSFRVKGMKAKGTVEVTDREIILTGDLPLMAKPFESKISRLLEGEAKNVFRAV